MVETTRLPLLGALLLILPLLAACDEAPAASDTPAPVAPVSFNQQIRPVIEQKCIACHGCYDAPCQLKLETAAGLDRGASSMSVYAQRTEAAEPTRLFTDAQTTAEWRERGFFSVIDSKRGLEESLLYRMLELGRAHRFEPGERLPEEIALGLKRDNQCPAPDEMDDYADKHPLGGMPLGTPALSDDEFNTVRTW